MLTSGFPANCSTRLPTPSGPGYGGEVTSPDTRHAAGVAKQPSRAPAPARPETAPGAEPAVVHEVQIVDGRFSIARCTCGWHSAGRRARATVRVEARDHALLYADGRFLSREDD